MVDPNIIELVDEPTDWVNGLVIEEKPNGKLRISLDHRPLNKAIKREHLHPPYRERTLFSNVVSEVLFKIRCHFRLMAD